MIKIERLKDGAKVFVTRDGMRVQVFLNQLITHTDFQTVEVEGGTLVYSVDETEVLEMSGGQGKQIELNLSETVQDAVVIPDTVVVEVAEITIDAPTEELEVPKSVTPVIVKPAPRAKK